MVNFMVKFKSKRGLEIFNNIFGPSKHLLIIQFRSHLTGSVVRTTHDTKAANATAVILQAELINKMITHTNTYDMSQKIIYGCDNGQKDENPIGD